jgi:hypothetical protein
MSDRHPLDDAIDRAVRDMTHVAADDDAVARVMARVRETDVRDTSTRWITAPRVAWCGAMVLLLMAFLNMHSLLRFQRAPETPSLPPLAAREFPTRVMDAPSITQAITTARRAPVSDTVTASSIVNEAADPNQGGAMPELPPIGSDMTIASITPTPLGEAPAIQLEPLIASSLQVDDIPVPSIELPPVSPEQHK